MKNIFYCSSVQKDIFSDNARSKFKNYIDIDNLRYLPKGPIEVAVKRIMFDSADINSSQGTLALKSDLCRESAYNGKYEKILCTFQVRDTHHVEFNSPTYFSTKIELLSNVKFTIINLKTGEQPNWESGAPTFIWDVSTVSRSFWCMRFLSPTMRIPDLGYFTSRDCNDVVMWSTICGFLLAQGGE